MNSLKNLKSKNPKWTEMTETDLKNWKSLFYNISGIAQKEKDIRKQQIAEMNGFSFLTIWEDESSEKALEKVINLIKSKI